MRTDGMRQVGMLMLLLVCAMVYSQDRGAAREASVFTGETVDVPPFYLWTPGSHGPRGRHRGDIVLVAVKIFTSPHDPGNRRRVDVGLALGDKI
jgi:hypothetical protein